LIFDYNLKYFKFIIENTIEDEFNGRFAFRSSLVGLVTGAFKLKKAVKMFRNKVLIGFRADALLIANRL